MMRTVIDRATVVFEEGFGAFFDGTHRHENPYASGEDRLNWFKGWDHANALP